MRVIKKGYFHWNGYTPKSTIWLGSDFCIFAGVVGTSTQKLHFARGE